MKKLSLNAPAFQKGEVLTRSQLKKVLGGDGSGGPGTPGGNNGNPCPDNCTKYCHKIDGYMPAYGTCPSDIGGTTCHNYCCDGEQADYYWC